jgi:hypothetical protein
MRKLLLDNSTTHAVANGATPKTWGDGFKFQGFNLKMPHCRVLFLPPKTTSELQPCSHVMQASYNHINVISDRHLRWMLRVLEEFEGGQVDLEKMKPDVKQAILWTREAWNVGVAPKTILNCWRKAFYLLKMLLW